MLGRIQARGRETEKKEQGISLARKRLEYTGSRARPLKLGIGPKVKLSRHKASPRQEPILGEVEGDASGFLKGEKNRRVSST